MRMTLRYRDEDMIRKIRRGAIVWLPQTKKHIRKLERILNER